MMATLTEQRIPESRPGAPNEGRDRRRMPLVVALGVVVALVVGFGIGWLVFRDTGADVPADVEELIEAYETAWDELDGDAVAAVMAPNARHHSPASRNPLVPRDGATSDELASLFAIGREDQLDLEIDRVYGDLPYVVVSTGSAYGDEGISITYVGLVDGELLILDHFWFV
jgi:hypothetical protein